MATSTAPAAGTRANSPIVVDLGKKSSKQIKSLKQGKGKLMNDVAAVVEEVKINLGQDGAGKEFVPVVVVYRKKAKRRRGSGWLPLGF